MLSIKQLPSDEYERLPIKFDPASSIVVVAENEDTKEIKGICGAMGIAALEMWTAPDIGRRGAMGLKMLQELLTLLAASGEPIYYAFADTPEIAGYLQRLGLVELPYKVFIGLNPLLPKEKQECLLQHLSLQPSLVEAQASEPLPSPPTATVV